MSMSELVHVHRHRDGCFTLAGLPCPHGSPVTSEAWAFGDPLRVAEILAQHELTVDEAA